MKRWKLALSLAVVAALAVPGLAGTWRLAPGKWVDLTTSQKQRIARHVEQTNNCTTFSGESEYEEMICRIGREQLSDGGVWYPPERVTAKYLTTNLFVSAGAFIATFALVMFGPPIGRRYLVWLRS
jgi:hypothetical protein